MMLRQVHRAPVVAATAVTAALILAGCTPGGSDTPSQPDWATTAPEDAEGSIEVWVWAADQGAVDEIAAKFEDAYPNVDVDLKFTAYADYTRLLSAALASGDGPDAYMLEPNSLSQFGPLAENLTPLLEDRLGAEWREQISETSVAELTTPDDRVVGAPLQLNGNGMVLLNQGLIDDLGLEWPGDLSSLDELVEFCDVVRAKGKGCIGIGNDEWVQQDVFQAIANSIEPGVFTEAVRGERPFTDPVLVKAFTMFQTLFSTQVTPEGALAIPMYPDMDAEFQRGNLVALATGNWSAMNLLTEHSIQFQTGAGVTDPIALRTRLVPFPAVGGTEVGVFASVFAGMAMNQSSDNKAAAAAWIDWYALDPDARQKDSAEDLIGIPALKGVVWEPAGLAYPDLGQESIDYLITGFEASTDTRNIPYPDLVTALKLAFDKSASGSDSQAVAEELEAASRSITR